MTENTALKQARKAKGWTQEEAARRLNMHQADLSRYERGVTMPQIGIAMRFKNVYKLSLDEIYSNYMRGRNGVRQKK